MATMQKIATNLWFDNQAEEAAEFYTSVFGNSSIGRITRYGKAGYEFHGRAEGTVMTVEFQVEGQQFVALNGGPLFKFTEAVSFIVHCDTQAEVDYYWERLSEGGDPDAQQCGWLKDRYGISWQIVPTALTEMVSDPDAGRSERVLQVMYPMKKLDLETLKSAYEGLVSRRRPARNQDWKQGEQSPPRPWEMTLCQGKIQRNRSRKPPSPGNGMPGQLRRWDGGPAVEKWIWRKAKGVH